jgi:inhibitor of the pro-sigma K processing machinery
MTVNYSVILAYAVGIILLFLLGRLLLIPIKVVLKLVYNGLLGALGILLVNFIGGLAGFHLAFNVITAFVVGILGIPGLILLIAIKLIFGIW